MQILHLLKRARKARGGRRLSKRKGRAILKCLTWDPLLRRRGKVRGMKGLLNKRIRRIMLI